MFLIVCDCYEENTVNRNKCTQDNGYCICKDGWYGRKCLFGKLEVKTKSKYFTLSRGSLSKFSEERKRKQFPSNGHGSEEDQTVQSAPVQC